MTNHLGLAAATIAAIYQDRWQVELFFKALKQNLRVKSFVGTSANTLKIQIWTALIAILLLRYLKLRARWGWSLSNLVALLRQQIRARLSRSIFWRAQDGRAPRNSICSFRH